MHEKKSRNMLALLDRCTEPIPISARWLSKPSSIHPDLVDNGHAHTDQVCTPLTVEDADKGRPLSFPFSFFSGTS